MPTMFEEEAKARCPDCSQSLTFIRAKSHQKRWYCYACEKYVDRIAEPTMVKDAHARIEAITGLQVIDSHGMIVGRVRKGISNDTSDVRTLVLSVNTEQFKTLLDERDLPREFELGHEKIATVGDVVILSDVFSPSALAPPKHPEETSNIGKCSRCNAPLIAGAKHSIKCGALWTSASCLSCGPQNQ